MFGVFAGPYRSRLDPTGRVAAAKALSAPFLVQQAPGLGVLDEGHLPRTWSKPSWRVP